MSKSDYFWSPLSSLIHVQETATSENQFQLFKKLYPLMKESSSLESCHWGTEELAEMSIIGFDPKLIVTCDSNNFPKFKTGMEKFFKGRRQKNRCQASVS